MVLAVPILLWPTNQKRTHANMRNRTCSSLQAIDPRHKASAFPLLINPRCSAQGGSGIALSKKWLCLPSKPQIVT
jgi:hypothetical protein